MTTLVPVRNKMQSGSYMLTARPGRLDPSFNPAFTPAEMLRLGVFEGYYLNSALNEYPESWFKDAKLSATGPDRQFNAFKVKSRMPLSHWREKGWINEQDPRGWFEWYCRYYMGRRSEDDERQIKRWRAFVRHSAQVANNGNRDPHARKVQRQALLQWAWDPFPDLPNLPGETAFKKARALLKEIEVW